MMMLSMKPISSFKPKVLKCCGQNVCRYFDVRFVDRRNFARNAMSVVNPEVAALRNKLVYCDHLDKQKVRVGYVARKLMSAKKHKYEMSVQYQKNIYQPAQSVLLNKISEQEREESDKDETELNIETNKPKPIHMPYSRVDKYEAVELTETEESQENRLEENVLNEKYKILYEKYLEAKQSDKEANRILKLSDYMKEEISSKVPPDWMTDYEEFDDTLLEQGWEGSFGTPDPNSKITSIPCGGCGALMHCKDPALPGYLPSELFPQYDIENLKSVTCQRCHFLKYYKTALEVKVSAEEYPELLKVLKTKRCTVIVVVDLLDIPCSIWPNLKRVLHPHSSIILVGNKIDLLPQDSRTFLKHVREFLANSLEEVTQIRKNYIEHVALISAKTGYGIENLINKVHENRKCKGDVYLIGCTNVGKSSLFNTLLKSDFCKSEAVDLVQRATTSPWPGTTLNLLKFPILKPTRQRLYERTQRLLSEKKFRDAQQEYLDNKFKETRKVVYATLQGQVGRTFSKRRQIVQDEFAETSHRVNTGKPTLDETKEEYAMSRWCYDTPGTIQRDQVLDLLTTDELLLTLPRQIISPRTFVFKPGYTLYLAGLGRIDYLPGQSDAEGARLQGKKGQNRETEDKQRDEEQDEESEFIRCTVFASNALPLTICLTKDADEIYNKLLRTEAFVVPTNDPRRLKLWPALGSTEMTVNGIGENESAADIVLSSAGWVAVTLKEHQTVTFRAWTPEARGLHLRSPALLRKSVTLRGARVFGTPMYKLGRQAYRK